MICLSLLALTSCNDQWDDHYGEATTASHSLWEEIGANVELKPFADLLSTHGFDRQLSTNQRFTVWAPMGAVDTTLLTGKMMSQDEVEAQVIRNHIARSAFSYSSLTNDTVVVLNGKRMPFVGSGNDLTFNGVPVTATNIQCSNGILHLIQYQARFNHNIWTYLHQDNDLTLVADYLYSFNRQVFDESASTLGGVIGGKKYFTDSVFVTQNDLWSDIGNLSDESKDFRMLVPTNGSWEQKVTEFSSFFNYPQSEDSTLGGQYARRKIVESLVYDTNSRDTLPGFFHRNIMDSVDCSNGWIYKTGNLDLDPYQAIAQPVIVEAEQESKYVVNKSNCSQDDAPVSMKASDIVLSGSAFLALTPSSTILKPSVTFALPNLLSCKYDIGIVLVPLNLTANGYSSTIDPKKYRINVELRDGNTGVTEKLDHLEADGTSVDTLWVARDHVFEYCDYHPDRSFLESNVTLKITNDAKRSETSTYTRNLYIDCIVVKPHQ